MRKTAFDSQPLDKAKHKKTARLLDLYIRNNNKQALLVHTPRIANLDHITHAISTRFRVPPEHQALFHNGRQINETEENRFVQVQDKAVIHLVDRRNVKREITINVRRLNIPEIQQFRIPSAQIIEDFIVRNIRDEEPEKLFFVYTGRQLKNDRSFQEEFVENDSQLFCLHEDRDEVKGERRKFYEKKIKQETRGRQSSHSNGQTSQHLEEDGDNVLVNYLPKERRRSEDRCLSKEANQQEEVQPNFKKKNSTKQIILSGNVQPLRKSNIAEGNLSVVTQQFQESHSGLGNSNYFNEGSSISEIMPDYSQNPESSKRIEEGAMFQSAFMGLSNQPSQVQGRAIQNDIPEEQERDRSKNGQSFSFDGRAPELLDPPNKQLTLLERQILEVTESQQLSQQNTSSKQQKQSNEHSLESPSERRSCQEREDSNEHSQFELGQIQNHLLSASTELKVQDPNSPMANCKSKSKNEILIEEQNYDYSDNKSSGKLEQNDNGPQDIEYVGIEIKPIIQRQSEKSSNIEAAEVTEKEECASRRSKDEIQIYEEKSNETPFFDNPASQQQLDVFIIERGNHHTGTPSGVSEIVEQKEEVETHGPSSSSNFYSKNSSRVRQVGPSSNEYEFGQYNKPFNRPTTQSGCYEANYDNDDVNFASRSNSKHQKSNSAVHASKQIERYKPQESEDLELQIVDLPLEIKAQEHAQQLLNYESEIILKSKLQGPSDLRKSQKREDAVKDGSRIDQLNLLLEDNSPEGKFLEQPVEEEKDSNLLSQQNSLEQANSDVKVETSLNSRYVPNQENEDESFSHESLEQVRLKKTLVGLNSAPKLEASLKSPHKEHFSAGHLIFNNETSNFDPLQFYITLLQKETV